MKSAPLTIKKLNQASAKKWLLLPALIGILIGAAFFFTPKNDSSVSAANAQNFSAGNIISDYVMSNKNSMNESDISNFMHNKAVCNDSNLKKVINNGNWQSGDYIYTPSGDNWHVRDGHFVCLADESFDGETSAHIIWQAAQDYSINPQVLLVLLQKEQGLIQDSFPRAGQYKIATGYGCPDTAACDAKYYGFKNQVRNAASLFRYVLDGKSTTYYPVGQNNIYWHPNHGCGTSSVYVENRATSALYRYTPYRPNQAALNAGYGIGDGCSAYGNRNFYLYFTDWFGSTQTTIATNYLESLQTGNYTIKVAADTNKTVFSNEANAYITGNGNQLKIAKNVDLTYTIIDPITNKAFDVKSAIAIDSANVRLYEQNGTDAQKWKIRINSDSTYSFISALNNYMVLDISKGIIANNQPIQLYSSNGTAAQKFYIVGNPPIADGTYTISTKLDTNKVLDVLNRSTLNGANVQIYQKNGDDNLAQQWKLVRNSDTGYYTIMNTGSGKLLDVLDRSTLNNANVQIYQKNGDDNCAQQWRIVKNANDSIGIFSVCSDKMLDVTNRSSANGTNVQIYQKNGDDNLAQQWVLNRIN